MKNLDAIKVLIVDDMSSMQKIIQNLLMEIGVQHFELAYDGKEGIEAALKNCDEGAPFDIIFSDVNMPIISGIDMVKKLRADERFGETPIIMISAETEVDAIKGMIEAGATDRVEKPFRKEALLEKMKMAMKGKVNFPPV